MPSARLSMSSADGQPCNDGRECITNTTCLAGECRGGQLKTCPEPENPCMMAVCDLESDGCVMMPKLNGTSCSRVPGSCTDDTCQGGVCTAGSARPNACSGVTANFGCQVSRCNITTGRCELQPVAGELASFLPTPLTIIGLAAETF